MAGADLAAVTAERLLSCMVESTEMDMHKDP